MPPGCLQIITLHIPQEYFLLKLYVFIKNILLHNLMCEIKRIVTIKDMNNFLKNLQKENRNGPYRPGGIPVLNSNDRTFLSARPLNFHYTLSELHSSIGIGKGIPAGLQWITDRNRGTYWVEKARFGRLWKIVPQIVYTSVLFFKHQNFISVVYVFSIHHTLRLTY